MYGKFGHSTVLSRLSVFVFRPELTKPRSAGEGTFPDQSVRHLILFMTSCCRMKRKAACRPTTLVSNTTFNPTLHSASIPPPSQPVLPRQNQAESGPTKIKVNPTEVPQDMCHPVQKREKGTREEKGKVAVTEERQ